LNAGGNLNSMVVPGGHSWDENRMNLTAGFLCESFNLDKPNIAAETGVDEITQPNLEEWSDEFLDVSRIASHLSGSIVKERSVLELLPIPDDTLDDTTKAFFIQTKLFVDGFK
jgi:hypothetical protein